MFKVFSIALVVILGLLACAVFETSEATHMLNGEPFSPVPVESVEIYIQKPEFAYVIVGTVEARGMGFTDEARDQELAIAALKREAAGIGADGVIVTDSNQKIADVNKYGTSTERRIKGTAIRRERE